MNLRLRWVAILLLFCAGVAAQSTGYWLDVPFVKQSPEGCGAASLSMVMQYWKNQGFAVSPDSFDENSIFSELHSPEGHGIYASRMKQFLEDHSFSVYTFSGQWDDLRRHLEKGRPMIVGLQPVRGSKALHYVVVAGVDLKDQLVLFNDPAGRKLTKLDRKTFEKQWNATERWTLLALPKNKP
jgi:uncharacterized protein YvpB